MKRKISLFLAVILILSSMILSSCKPSEVYVDDLLKNMTIEEKIGQLFIIYPESLAVEKMEDGTYSPITENITDTSESMADMVKEYPPGGVIIFGGNITRPTQIKEFTEKLQGLSEIPLFMAIDEEGGRVSRLANGAKFDLPLYESPASIGESGDPNEALSMGETIGSYLKEYGFNMDFAPVADVNLNPENTVIGDRAFSSDPETASKMSHAMAEGLESQGIIPVFKHFPGHGDTSEDSHTALALNNKTKEELLSGELLPYIDLKDTYCVMAGHIASLNITGDKTPATFSSTMINELLRKELGFDGVVITDSLAMGAVTNDYSAGEAAVSAIEAGCDILLCSPNYQEAFEAILEAYESGRLSKVRIDESVYRILTLKKAYGLFDTEEK